MRFAVPFAVLGSVLSFSVPAVSDDHAALIKQWERQEGLCRGGNSDKVVEAACDKREQLVSQLGKIGWCFGDPERQAAYQYRWHRCSNQRKSSSNESNSPSKPVGTTVSNGKTYDDLLKGTWGDTDYKNCKLAKEADRFAFYNGSKFNAPEQDCIVLSSKSKTKAVNLKMLCVLEGGEKSKVNGDIKFVNDNTIKIDADEYRRCSE